MEDLLPQARGRVGPAVASLAARGGTWRYRTSFPREREVRAPEASPDEQAHGGLAPTCDGTGPRGGSGPVEVRPEHPALVGTWRRRTYKSTGEGSETMIPAVRYG
jgi:hypothetical protein